MKNRIVRIVAVAALAWGFWAFDPNTNGLWREPTTGGFTSMQDCNKVNSAMQAQVAPTPTPSPTPTVPSAALQPLVILPGCYPME